jgi:hypothetical protein
MMKRKGETKRHRIIIWYVLAIVLPCLIMGFLAFRGVKYDQALVEREKRSDLIEAGGLIIMETDAFLSTIENDFAEITRNIDAPSERIFHDSLLDQFSLKNKGIAGIFFMPDDNKLSKVFEPFYRIGQEEGAGGTGLGLTVVKEIVEAHGGSITVTSKTGEGSKFVITLNQQPA